MSMMAMTKSVTMPKRIKRKRSETHCDAIPPKKAPLAEIIPAISVSERCTRPLRKWAAPATDAEKNTWATTTAATLFASRPAKPKSGGT